MHKLCERKSENSKSYFELYLENTFHASCHHESKNEKKT